jgi:hypothetical protein
MQLLHRLHSIACPACVHLMHKLACAAMCANSGRVPCFVPPGQHNTQLAVEPCCMASRRAQHLQDWTHMPPAVAGLSAVYASPRGWLGGVVWVVGGAVCLRCRSLLGCLQTRRCSVLGRCVGEAVFSGSQHWMSQDCVNIG